MNKRLTALGILLVLLSILFMNCAAILNNSGKKVGVNSTPTGAEVYVNGEMLGRTPVTLELDRKQHHEIVVKHDGEERTYVLTKKLGAGWIVLDVLFGVVPVAIDAATGAWYSLQPKELDVDFSQQ